MSSRKVTNPKPLQTSSAVQVAAAGPAMTVGGTGLSDGLLGDVVVVAHVPQQMSDAGVAARNAAKHKNFDAARNRRWSPGRLVRAVPKDFKPALPTEGVVHTHMHSFP
jgi:hypothetical protein